MKRVLCFKKILKKKLTEKRLERISSRCGSDSDCVDERHKAEKQQKRVRWRRPLLMFSNKYMTNNVIKMGLIR